MKVTIERPESEFPELIVTVPDSWPYINLKPFYDVHYGHSLHATKQFLRAKDDVISDPYALSFDGGDMWENAVLGSPGLFSQNKNPDEQFQGVKEECGDLKSKLLFKLPGNHEHRTARVSGFDIARALADMLGIQYFPDFCFCTIRWRGKNFRLKAHHGTGAAQTPGGQRNAARKDLPWIHPDIDWTGHLHQSLVDGPLVHFDYDQKTGLMYTRQSLVIIAPSFLKYFGGYAAEKRLAPGALGIVPVTLRADGRMEAMVSAKGRRL